MTASLLTLPQFHPLLEGTLGFSFPGVQIPGLKNFLLNVQPSPEPGMELINMFWEEQFGCKLEFGSGNAEENGAGALHNTSDLDVSRHKTDSQNISAVGQKSSFKVSDDENEGPADRPVCSGAEDLSLTASSYTDVSPVRISYNVYKAVYALAHALHALLDCNSVEETCEKHKYFTTSEVGDFFVFLHKIQISWFAMSSKFCGIYLCFFS